ncbi:MAG: putative secreted calcium-binding protein, partial [Phycisphaerales bacterium]|nr:putative secreted calcium-binding protein [Phycisphaerales bacterium]
MLWNRNRRNVSNGPVRAAAAAMCEDLEARVLLAVTGSVSPGHTLSVNGDTNGQTITLSGSGSTITVLANGVAISGSPFAGVTTQIVVDASSGADTIDVSGVTNTLPISLTGGSGNDTLVGNASANVFSGGGNEDSITGGGGDDLLSGGDGDDTLNGDGGSDTLDGGNGADDLHGGGNSDIVDYSARSTGIIADIDSAQDSGSSADLNAGGTRKDHIFSDVEVLYGTSGNDTLTGSGLGEAIYGNAGVDLILGRGGNDALFGGAGADSVWGGDGADVLYQNDSANTNDSAIDDVDQNQSVAIDPDLIDDHAVDHL